MTVTVLFKDGCYVEYDDIKACNVSYIYSDFICLVGLGEEIYLNKDEITSFIIKWRCHSDTPDKEDIHENN